MTDELKQRIAERLEFLYGKEQAAKEKKRFLDLITGYEPFKKKTWSKWDEKEVALITYGDSIIDDNRQARLKTLKQFLNKHLKDTIHTVHILPFFPYSSDYGFAVKDFTKVNPELGGWSDIGSIVKEFRLMADLVINHVSSEHPWFRNFIENREPGKDYFIVMDKDADLREVVRPRSSPLLTPFETSRGEKYVWTTFSADQIDLDFSNPDVLYEMAGILLHYLEKGVEIIRMDAIAYLWKKQGTSCIHLPESHEVVKMMRDIAEYINPESIILTETNVPHKENISYFGKGDEAHMVYQFTLPPLLLYSLNTGNARYLSDWLKSLAPPPAGNTFLNFTASHDGIGVRPLEGILPENEITQLIDDMKSAGGMVSTKKNADGSESPYEINITYFDALKRTRDGEKEMQEERFICSQTLMLALKGVPAFYIQSLIASRNDYEKARKTGIKRDINRTRWGKEELEKMLGTDNVHSRVFIELKRIIRIRKMNREFHPNAEQVVQEAGPGILVLKRMSGAFEITCITNLSSTRKEVMLKEAGLDATGSYEDLLAPWEVNIQGSYVMEPYQNVWLKRK